MEISEKKVKELSINPFWTWWDNLPLSNKIMIPMGTISILATGTYLLTRQD